MSQCLNPDCLVKNSEKTQFCRECGAKLLLSDRYRALNILGKGGFGRTFLAIDEQKPSKPRCVIKQFLPQVKSKKGLAKAAELFEREAMRLDELGQHSQIPSLLAFFNQEEQLYLIQEFIDGNDLQKELTIQGVFHEQQIKELLNDMLAVLNFVHSNNVIHRDIKPENIIRRKEDNKLVLVDFGAAKSTGGLDTSKTGTIIGSAAYISPEQAAGKPKFASDLYSLGATCLHLLTNTEPTELFDLAEGEWMWREYLEDNDISYELSRVLDKLVEGATKRRFQTVEEVLEALSRTSGASHIKPTKPFISDRYRVSKTAQYGVVARHKSSTVSATKRRKPPSVQNLKLQVTEYSFVTVAKNDSVIVGRHSKLKTIEHQGKAKYTTFDLGQEVTIDLVGIPSGQFIMGSPENEAERGDNESPQHPVKVRPFLIGKYPVTQAQWSAIMKQNPSRFTENSDLPVEKVSWFDCVEFCQKLSDRVGREIRLPTEAEWEYACRGKLKTPFHFGSTITTELANYNGEFTYGMGEEGENRNQTTKVGSFSPNSFGLYDLHGNVAEWCQDTWHDSYQGAPNNGSSWQENSDLAVGEARCDRNPRVLRGGSWLHLPGCCRSAYRLKAEPNSKSDAFGFRIAMGI
ncbi:Serine/threonine protein kinase [Hyella patelloides LEGE 07179]|uniref:Serine/threonine protein kinase n=1 Tax=Hyella patelloides LEGE 07179 TaxID=945734 RepID=A0A563W421_9CYAN|nr:bifunctional serine/threonine-protein kinase/formylglycine-generating enzyme family protein [Hyella patelloides]VEP18449.1 Serine/threonine protein kinase [Hyella patelloides LEGE 07179]